MIDNFPLFCSVPLLLRSWAFRFFICGGRRVGWVGIVSISKVLFLMAFTASELRFSHFFLLLSVCVAMFFHKPCKRCSKYIRRFLCILMGIGVWKISRSLGNSHSLLPSGYYTIHPLISLVPLFFPFSFTPYPASMIYGDDGFAVFLGLRYTGLSYQLTVSLFLGLDLVGWRFSVMVLV